MALIGLSHLLPRVPLFQVNSHYLLTAADVMRLCRRSNHVILLAQRTYQAKYLENVHTSSDILMDRSLTPHLPKPV